MFQQFEVRKLQIAITIFFLELNFQKHEFYARRTLTFWWKLQRQREGKFIMLTDSAQTVIAVVFTVLIITDIVGNTLVCVVLIKNQDMRWVSTRTFQLFLTPSNLQQFSLNAFLCNQSNFSETKLFFITLGRSCQMCFRTLKQWASKKKTFQITSVCALLITYKYIYARV